MLYWREHLCEQHCCERFLNGIYRWHTGQCLGDLLYNISASINSTLPPDLPRYCGNVRFNNSLLICSWRAIQSVGRCSVCHFSICCLFSSIIRCCLPIYQYLCNKYGGATSFYRDVEMVGTAPTSTGCKPVVLPFSTTPP